MQNSYAGGSVLLIIVLPHVVVNVSMPLRLPVRNCSELYMRTMLALAYSFGFRKAELLTLKVSDTDVIGGTFSCVTRKTGSLAR
jgi:hypothetical protein